MNKGGADISRVEVRFHGTNSRGVHAARDIKKGETILFVPKSLILTFEKARTTPIAKKMLDNADLLERVGDQKPIICAYILSQRRKVNKASQEFGAYLETLPTNGREFPIFFGEEEYGYLEGSPFIDVVKHEKESFMTRFVEICAEIEEYKSFTVDEYKEVMALIYSRAFKVTIDGEEEHWMVPFADMFNHRLAK